MYLRIEFFRTGPDGLVGMDDPNQPTSRNWTRTLLTRSACNSVSFDLSQTTYTDQGTYNFSCSKDSPGISFCLDVLSDPVAAVTTDTPNTHFAIGEKYTFNCNVEGRPFPNKVYWHVQTSNVLVLDLDKVNTTTSELPLESFQQVNWMKIGPIGRLRVKLYVLPATYSFIFSNIHTEEDQLRKSR